MAQAKTQPTSGDVTDFLAAVQPPARGAEGRVLDTVFQKLTGQPPRLWGPSIVGYGEYNTVYDSGRKVSGPRTAFSPRKARHSLYLSCGSDAENAQFAPLLARLGKFSQAKACFYVNRLADIDLAVLEEMIALSWRNSLARYPA